jgi:hypothetical protein
MIIAIPSSNRSEAATTQKVLMSAIMFVPENQVSAYEQFNSCEIVGVPLDFDGITKTRNWILKYTNEDVLFVDDDVRECGYFSYGDRINLKDGEYSFLWESEFEKIFEVCKGMGFKIWGAESGGSKFSHHPLMPFSFASTINGSMMGIVNDGEFYFDEQFPVKEDYEIMLRHYKQKGGILKVRYFYWRNFHWGNEGGCVDYRTDKMEENAIDLLEARYPAMVRRNERKNKHSILITWD